MTTPDLIARREAVRMPNLLAAFRTTTSGDGSYTMTFKFPSMQAMHDADDEWHALRNAVETQPEASRSPVSEERAEVILNEEWYRRPRKRYGWRYDAAIRAMIRFVTDTQPVAGGGE